MLKVNKTTQVITRKFVVKQQAVLWSSISKTRRKKESEKGRIKYGCIKLIGKMLVFWKLMLFLCCILRFAVSFSTIDIIFGIKLYLQCVWFRLPLSNFWNRNPNKGVIINNPNGTNVYGPKKVNKDYVGDSVSHFKCNV